MTAHDPRGWWNFCTGCGQWGWVAFRSGGHTARFERDQETRHTCPGKPPGPPSETVKVPDLWGNVTETYQTEVEINRAAAGDPVGMQGALL